MLVKASILATIAVAATVTLTSVDFRDLYNEMYPVNGLKRDVLGLCHQAKPSFIRAVRGDRETCYDSMPDSVEMAIGWVRTTSMVAELNLAQTPVEAAERSLKEAIKTGRFGIKPQFTGFVAPAPATRPCPEMAKALVPFAPTVDPKNGKPGDRLAKRLTGNDAAALTALGLAPRGAKPGMKTGMQGRAPDLPVLSLNGAPVSNAAQVNTDCKTPI